MIVATAAAGYLLLSVLSGGLEIARPEERPVVQYSFEAEEDLDFDDLPDDWVRRKGPKFPRYVKIVIDSAVGSAGSHSLRIDANGGAAVLYSPLTQIDDLHTYQFRGKVRTRGLKQAVALVSVSLLNERRERLQRFLTVAVGGERQDWIPVAVGPISPLPQVRFVVIGCHLLPGEETEIDGSAWFDELGVTRSPRLAIESNFDSHFRKEGSEINVISTVSGLDAGHDYEIRFEFRDADGEMLAEHAEALASDQESSEETFSSIKAHPVRWNLNRQEPGFYRLSATLRRDGQDLLREETSLAVMKLVEKGRSKGEFGWSISTPPRQIPPDVLANIASQAGINWIKYPVWNSVRLDDPKSSRDLADFFDRLDDAGIATVGVISDPPESLRAKFARNWLGISEIFSTQSSVWGPSLEPVVARFSSTIRHWQIGGEDDSSFEGLSDLTGTLLRLRKEINQIGLNAEIGIPWQLQRPPAEVEDRGLGFVSLRETNHLDYDALRAACIEARQPPRARWLVLKPDVTSDNAPERANHLVRQMLAAKVAGVEAIFIDRVIDGRSGLLQPDGAPSELFLPWRTTALALQDAEYLGEIIFPQKSRNAVFARNKEKEVVIFIWNDVPAEEPEQFYLGEDVVEVDLWGRTKPLEASAKGQTIVVNKTPKILLGCSEAVARWRLSTQFALGKIRSEYGSHEDAVLGRNTFSSGVSGRVVLETPSRERHKSSQHFDRSSISEAVSGWQAEPREWQLTAAAHEEFRLPVFLTLPNDANLGDSMMKLTFQVVADRPYSFDVLCPYQVGLGDVTLEVIDRKLPDGQLEIEQVVKNNTSPIEVLDFRCSLKVPDSRRQRLQITKLGTGEDRKFYYLDQADRYHGQELRLRIEQDGGGRIMNYNWIVGKDWVPATSEPASALRDGDSAPR